MTELATPAPPRGFALLLVLTMGAGPLALYAVTALSPLLVAELGLSRSALGSLAGVTFVAAAACALLGGALVDRVSERLVTLLVLAGGVLALGLVTAASGMAWLVAAAIVSGAAQSVSNPVTNRLVSLHVPVERLGPLVGIKQSGVQLAQFAAGAALPGIAALAGWRVATACAVVLAAAGLVLVRRSVPARPAPVGPAERGPRRRIPADVWWLLAFTLLTASALQATNVYLPLFAHDSLGLGVTLAGITAAVAGAAGIAARIGWTRLAGRSDGQRPLLFGLAVAAAAGALLLVAAESLHLPWLLWPAVLVHGATALGSNAVVMLAVVRRARGGAVGGSSGVLAFGLYAGFAVGPFVFGHAVEGSVHFAPAWTAVAATYLLAALVVVAWGRVAAR
ncbi:MFS transporter [Pseudonocardia sp. H11422]|uniref:MFS transporter n=1 Tax=Pseudonocardia sp. H11422 TaxID=2835866 RepID=UPI001BDD19DC|nr:MFS transporter [Pseudonocardia sp. H11422]